MTDVVAKNWAGLLTEGGDGRLYSDPADAPGGGGGAVEVSRYPLELVSPREAGTAPSADVGTPNMATGHRIFKAYPGIPYEIPVHVIGGSFPYTYSLTNAPSGMELQDRTDANGNTYKVVYWPSPTGTTETPNIEVTDAENNSLDEDWTIAITTSGFKFISDPSTNTVLPDGNDGTGTGSITQPWATLAKVKSTSSAGDICYFDGEFTIAGMATSSGDYISDFNPAGNARRVEFNGGVHSTNWLAYPGASASIDLDNVPSVQQGSMIQIQASDTYPAYMHGIELTNGYHCGFRVVSAAGHYLQFVDMDINTIDQSVDGQNSGGFMFSASVGDHQYYTAIIGSHFHDNACGGVKSYTQNKLLWANNRFADGQDGPDIKGDHERWEVRQCVLQDTTEDNHGGLFGNMQTANDGEIRFNLIDRTGVVNGEALSIGEGDTNGEGPGETHVYRNTFLGRVVTRGLPDDTGPKYFDRNVIIVDDDEEFTDRIALDGTPGANVINYGEESGANLVGGTSDGIVDANGDLQGAYLAAYGPESENPTGHMLP